MNPHLAEIAKNVAHGAHAVLLLDQAGWHMTDKLDVPANITILPLPPKCPELNPTENVRRFMRDNWLSNRVFKSYDDTIAATHGTSSSASLGASCPSGCAIGPIGSDHCGLV
jgi:transposase